MIKHFHVKYLYDIKIVGELFVIRFLHHFYFAKVGMVYKFGLIKNISK